ncbi:MAG: hypothetical protein HYZ37_14135 [Candidatus Solibacter usitatus]|nr:hypothetical protein [Candidatus Solibacter usitatus]
MTRYLPSKQYRYAGAVAFGLAALSGFLSLHYPLVWIPAGLFLATAAFLLVLSTLPAIEIHETHLKVGGKLVLWEEIRRLDRTGFVSPLVMNLALDSGHRMFLIYPGGLEASTMLLRHLRRMAREALIDGIPYQQFWRDAQFDRESRALPAPKYQLLLPEDEAEVERLFQKLKTAGRLDRSDES